MTLTLGHVLLSAGIAANETLVIRHAYVRVHEDNSPGIHADSTDAEILAYTSQHSVSPRIFRLPRRGPGSSSSPREETVRDSGQCW